jgi:phage terminase Nu1 subunit (DNA packaging protein)
MPLIDSGPLELIGFKEIAKFLAGLAGRRFYSERQVQNFVKAGMPVHREEGKSRGWVCADPAEIAAWWERRTNKRN